ncbi:MAG: AsmA-like C-terminal region-containing protein, partial [Gammaproteobacteria bacterium]|nr:AsmA-like C-terminal region-containing protein [Gammaproteobacteria bacterium]
SGEISIFSFYPGIIVHDATVFSDENKNSLLSFSTAKVSLNLRKTVEEKSWVIRKIDLQDLKIFSRGENSTGNKALIHWLKSQESVNLNHVEINTCDAFMHCKPVFLFSASLEKKGTYQTIKITAGVAAQKTTLTGKVRWEEGSELSIENQRAIFFGDAIVRYDVNQHFSLSAKGNGKIQDLTISQIQATCNQKTDFIAINGVATGGVLEKLFPGKSTFSATIKAEIIKIFVRNPGIIGTFIVNQKKSVPVRVSLQRLVLQFNNTGNFSIDVNPQEIPALAGSVDDLVINGKSFGHLSWQSAPVLQGMALRQLKLVSAFSTIVSQGYWLREGALGKITLSGLFTSSNFGEWFQKVHHISRVKNGTLNLKFSLETVGLPNTIFSLKNLKGTSQFKMENVSIAHANQKNKSPNFFESVLNLISLQSISDFLTLDFSALKKSEGFKIFVLKGDMAVENGHLMTQNIFMKSAVANINFSGNVDFINDQDNLKMIVYPNIIQSPPLGSCPVLLIYRLPLWIWKKISSHFLDPFFNMQYKVTGTLEKPAVVRL